MLRFALALATLFVSAPALADEPDNFTYKVESAALALNVPGAVTVLVDVAPGYHWNDEYPAKLTIKGAPEGVTVVKPELKQLSGDFKSETPTKVKVLVPLIATAAANGSVTVDAKFSICNERVCLMKSASATAAVVAK